MSIKIKKNINLNYDFFLILSWGIFFFNDEKCTNSHSTLLFFFFLVYYEIGDLLNFLAHIKISLEIANINVYLYKPKNHL